MIQFLKNIFKIEGDKIIWIITLFLCGISLIAVYSASGTFGRQLFLVIAGLITMFIFSKIDYTKLSKFSFIIFIFGLILLIATLIFGESAGDAKRSLRTPIGSIQTLYIVGFCTIIFFAQFLTVAQNNGNINKLSTVITAFTILSIICILIFMANFSTALILFISILILFFISEIKMSYILKFCLIGIIGVSILLFSGIGRGSTGIARIEHYLGIETNANFSKQIETAKAAIARTGFIPEGPGQGVLTKNLAEKDTDYIYAVVFEELGALVGIAILLAYIILCYRVLIIALRTKGLFGFFLVSGLGFWICCQAFIHIGVNCNLLPATGQTLPFISRGGMSIIISGAAFGILLSISKLNPKENKNNISNGTNL